MLRGTFVLQKIVLASSAILAISDASAHRPRIIDCQTYAHIAVRAASDRNSGMSLDTSLIRLKEAYRFDAYFPMYFELTRDVYTQQDLQGVAPEIIAKSAEFACLDHNREERRTREQD